ncbi:MAG: methyltransferase type 12, partial [Gammaproteobacteria bacterium]|nr:methyltransferase type 12 [Gammaproteobacteria bacterium]NIR95449.1 methyltransferase type 12 [Gammaproteobacteria bacterium]NIW41596.1 methyltransferase type 12 [candidate division Zixibacteria bacterium]NIX58371.1 methyltransferase type 12 [candidate division Zixibacteria bacterium]
AMDELQRPHAHEVAKALPLHPGKKILDCGGGPGTYARAFVEVSSETEVTLFDLPGAIPIARSLEGEHPIRYLSGDFFTDDLGDPYDGIFL